MTAVATSRREIQARLEAALAGRTPAAVATIVRGEPLGAKLLMLPNETLGSLGDAALDSAVESDARELLEQEKSETRPYSVAGREEVEVFVEAYPPPPTLLIFGAVHVAQPLSRFAKALGFDVIVSDARAKLATRERFPDADRIIQGWPDETLQQVEIRPNTYVAILSHDPKFDEPALVGTLGTPAAYIGAIGSRGTNEDRRRRLAEAGVSPEQIARLRAPIGLDIGAATPEEMAISILGEIISLRRGRSGGSLTQATGRIRGEHDSRRSGVGSRESADRDLRPPTSDLRPPTSDLRPPTSVGVIAGVILAAGLSSRLGRPKQLLPLGGEPLIRHTLRRALAAGLDEVIVVVGHEAEAVAAAIADLPSRVVINPEFARGQSTSVRAGLESLSAETEAVLFLLGDQPGVEPAVIDALIAAWRETRVPVVAPRYTDAVGNPVLFDRSVFSELAGLKGDTGARSVVRAYQSSGGLLLVPVERAAPADVDTEVDYAALLARANPHPPTPSPVEDERGGRLPSPRSEGRRAGDERTPLNRPGS